MILDELKARARVLQQAANRGDAAALFRIQALHNAGITGSAPKPSVRRSVCLSALARELGFNGWAHLVAVFSEDPVEDYGTMLYPERCCVHSNVWVSNYKEALAIYRESQKYLLPWRRHFLLVDEHYLRTLGLDPNDDRWERMGRDWVQPNAKGVRETFYGELTRARSTPV